MSNLKKNKQPHFAALDIGSSKVCFVIGQVSGQRQEQDQSLGQNQGEPEISVIGLGETPHNGVSKGAIVHIDATIKAILQAKQEAETMAACKADRVWLSLCGDHIQSFASKGVIAVRNKEVSFSDIKRVLDATRMIRLSSDEKVLHTLPKNFKVDAQDGIKNPLGMFCVRLESCAHIVVGNSTACSNYTKCASNAGLKMEALILSSLASAQATLTEDEKKLGVALIDIGAETTKIICYSEGHILATGFLPFGGAYFTKDIAVGLRTSSQQAENIKKEHGCVLKEMVHKEAHFHIQGGHGKTDRKVSTHDLVEILFPRAKEFFDLLDKMFKNWKVYPHLGGGFVFTGGASLLPGLIELAEFNLDLPVRLGIPFKLKGLGDMLYDPSYSTVLGLLQMMEDNQKKDVFTRWKKMQNLYSHKLFETNLATSFGYKMKDFFSKLL